MSQSDMVIADQPGASFLADLNAVIAALVTNSSGATAPTTTYPYQPWADTGSTPPMLRQRNAANNDWLPIGPLADLGIQTGAQSLATVGGTADALTLTFSPALTALHGGIFQFVAGSDNATTTPTGNLDGLGAKTFIKGNNLALVAGDIKSGMTMLARYDSALGKLALLNPATGISAGLSASSIPDVAQTVLSGPVDTNGFAAFGGSTGTATLTTSGTLKATCFSGSGLHRTGDITNAAFTSPGGTSTAFLYLEISAAGVVTEGVSTLPWVYQPGGTPSVTSGQHTVNYKEGKVYVGNGSTATQVYRVCIGECPHTGGSWSGTPIWYALKGEYRSATAAPLFGTGVVVSYNHNLGITPEAITGSFRFFAYNITPEQSWTAGAIAEPDATVDASGMGGRTWGITTRNVATVCGGANGTGWQASNRTTGGVFQMVLGRWGYFVALDRGW